jgi:Tat protein secretion system quality control protein TatD with DNase activity
MKFIDYIDYDPTILGLDYNYNRYEKDKKIFEDLRELSRKYDIEIIINQRSNKHGIQDLGLFID